MTKIEDGLVEIALQNESMNQPITVAEGLLLTNSLIVGTEIEDRVMDSYRDRKCFDDEDEYCGEQNEEEQKRIVRAGY